MWLGLSDQYSPRVLRWVDGSEVLTGEEGTRDRAMLQPGNVCVSLDGSGQPSSHSCTAKRAFVCQFTRQGKQHTSGIYSSSLHTMDANMHHLDWCIQKKKCDCICMHFFIDYNFLQNQRIAFALVINSYFLCRNEDSSYHFENNNNKCKLMH